MSKTPVVRKRKRAQKLADRLRDELGLDACTPVLTAADAEAHGLTLQEHQIAFVLERKMLRRAVPLSRKIFFGKRYDQTDQDYFFDLIGRVWLSYLKGQIKDAATVLVLRSKVTA